MNKPTNTTSQQQGNASATVSPLSDFSSPGDYHAYDIVFQTYGSSPANDGTGQTNGGYNLATATGQTNNKKDQQAAAAGTTTTTTTVNASDAPTVRGRLGKA